MTPTTVGPCLGCKHYTVGRLCAAYPTNLIPVEVWIGTDQHTKLRGDEEKSLIFEPNLMKDQPNVD